jgi:hypothetical protein
MQLAYTNYTNVDAGYLRPYEPATGSCAATAAPSTSTGPSRQRTQLSAHARLSMFLRRSTGCPDTLSPRDTPTSPRNLTPPALVKRVSALDIVGAELFVERSTPGFSGSRGT